MSEKIIEIKKDLWIRQCVEADFPYFEARGFEKVKKAEPKKAVKSED